VRRRLGLASWWLALAALAATAALHAGGAGGAGGAGWAGSGAGYDPGEVLAGRKLYLRHCAECHGGDARGGPRAPSLDTHRVGEAAPGDLFRFLTNGSLRAGMPAWSRLPAARRWQLTAYLKALGGAPAR
jgi:mono/diheme cytochrome c family protein